MASLQLDVWSADDRDTFMAMGGNASVNGRYQSPPFALAPHTSASLRNMFISAKYVKGLAGWNPASASHDSATHIENTNAGILRVELIHGRNLKVADVTGKSDPYVVFGVGRFKDKKLRSELSHAVSSVKRQTLNPDWNETFMINVPSMSDGLTAQVWDFDPPPKPHDFLGQAFIDLSGLKDNEPLELAPSLSKKGFIRVRLTWTKL